MSKSTDSSIEKRKESHIKICLNEKVESDISAGFEDVTLVHHALTGIDRNDINLSCKFLGKKLKAPIVIEAITGGAKISEHINKNLAEAAENVGVAFGLGSVRAALADKKLWRTYKVRDLAPTIPIISNIGLNQLIKEYEIKEIKSSIEYIGADALAIHLNALQETVQPEGDVGWKDSYKSLKHFAGSLGIPIIVKETGAGISRETALALENAGCVDMIDIAGLGGTSFSMVEHYRSKNDSGLAFRNWGIPTVCSLVECRHSVKLPLIASGGIRTGIDAAKAIALGADYVGMALPLLKPAMDSPEAVEDVLNRIISELKSAMFLSGASTLEELKKKDVIIQGRTREWLVSRGIKVENISNREA